MKCDAFGTVAIVGPGLIGGSLGLAMRAAGLARHVVGIGHRRESLDHARRIGAVDEVSTDLAAAAGADLVVLATRVELIEEQAAALLPCLKPGVILTDVGSVKASVCDAVARAMARHPAQAASFVGGHPLAGSEQRGIAVARGDLFSGAWCILTPLPALDPKGEALRRVRALWQAVGCRVREMSPQTHDRLLAQISHLPHVIASCLVNAVSDEALEIAARGFMDTTRVASGDALLWRDICLANAPALADAMRNLSDAARHFADALNRADAAAVLETLARAQNRRNARISADDAGKPA